MTDNMTAEDALVQELSTAIGHHCDQKDAILILRAMAPIIAQGVYCLAQANNVPPLQVIETFVDDLKQWVVKYIAFTFEQELRSAQKEPLQ